MEEGRFTSGIGVIHRDAGLDTIAKFFRVTKSCSLSNGIRVLAGREQCHPCQAKREWIKLM
jgi:hypothetical protein